jgi:hypothetical protein
MPLPHGGALIVSLAARKYLQALHRHSTVSDVVLLDILEFDG